MAWYSGDVYEQYMIDQPLAGPMRPIYWALIACNVTGARSSFGWRARPASLRCCSCCRMMINVGMWIGAFRHRCHQPAPGFSALVLGHVLSDRWDWMTCSAPSACFSAAVLLFVRLLPAISISEIREMLHEQKSRVDTQ